MKIPAANPLANYKTHRKALSRAVLKTLDRGAYILGPEVQAFEKEFARYNRVHSALGVASGTDALQLALKAVGVKPGDTVITVSHTAVATVAAIELAGAVPFLVDIDSASFTMNPAHLESSLKKMPAPLRKKAKAVIPVHLYGHAADMPAILKIASRHGLAVVEDCAQAAGTELNSRKAGSFGHAAAFSFYPTKNLGALGDGGAVLASSAAIAEKVRLQREYGWKQRYISSVAGGNSRLDEVQAAVLRIKLTHLDAENKKRAKIAKFYSHALPAHLLELPSSARGVRHTWHQYVIRSQKRDALRALLQKKGVGTLIHYPVPIHLQPAYRGRVRLGHGGLGETEKACGKILSLPVYPELRASDLNYTAAAINQSLRELS